MLVHRTKPSYRNQSLGGRAARVNCIDIMSCSRVFASALLLNCCSWERIPDLNYRVSTPLMIQLASKPPEKKINKFINDKVAFFLSI